MQLVNALNECGQNELPRAKSNCLQLPPTAYCSHSKVSPSLTCLSRFFCVSPPLPTSYSTPFSLLLLHSSLPSSTVFYLPLKAAEISFEICVCKFSCCCFRCFFFFCACLLELSFLLLRSPSCHPPFDRLSRFFYVCLFVMRYVPYEIWRIWYTEYVKLKFPTMLLLFLSATFWLRIPHLILLFSFIFSSLVLFLVPFCLLCALRVSPMQVNFVIMLRIGSPFEHKFCISFV